MMGIAAVGFAFLRPRRRARAIPQNFPLAQKGEAADRAAEVAR